MPAFTNYVMIPIMYETLKPPSVHTFSRYNHLLTVCSKLNDKIQRARFLDKASWRTDSCTADHPTPSHSPEKANKPTSKLKIFKQF
jgi:hypothetical protein